MLDIGVNQKMLSIFIETIRTADKHLAKPI